MLNLSMVLKVMVILMEHGKGELSLTQEERRVSLSQEESVPIPRGEERVPISRGEEVA